MLFSSESLKISTSKISDDNRLCCLNKNGLDDFKQFTVKLKWNSMSNVLQLLIFWAYFDYFSWRKRGNHPVSHFPHIFLFYAEADQHENVRQAVVCKRRGFTCVVGYTSSLRLAVRVLCHKRLGNWSLYPKSLRDWRSQLLFVILVQSQSIFNNFYLKWIIIKSCAFPVIL